MAMTHSELDGFSLHEKILPYPCPSQGWWKLAMKGASCIVSLRRVPRVAKPSGYALAVAPACRCAAPSILIIPELYETHPPKPQPLPSHPVPIGRWVSGTSGWVKE